MKAAIVGAALVVPALAAADHAPQLVRDDIVDIRHGRSPDRRVFLGWTADGRAVEHVVLCAPQNDVPSCSSSLVVGPATTALFDVGTYGLDISTEVASHAIHAEQAVLDKLGPLADGSREDALAGIAVAIDCDGLAIVRDGRVVARPVKLACPPPGMGDAETPFLDHARLRDVHISPDGHHAAVTFDWERTRTTMVTHATAMVVIDL